MSEVCRFEVGIGNERDYMEYCYLKCVLRVMINFGF